MKFQSELFNNFWYVLKYGQTLKLLFSFSTYILITLKITLNTPIYHRQIEVFVCRLTYNRHACVCVRACVYVCLCVCAYSLVTSWTAACQASLSFTISWSLLKLMSIKLVMPPNPTISSSVIPFTSCPQSFPASESFLISWLLASGGQNIGVSAVGSGLTMNIQGWLLLGLTGLISLLSKGLSRIFSSTTVQKQQFFGALMVQLSHPYMTTGKIIAMIRQTFVGKVFSVF